MMSRYLAVLDEGKLIYRLNQVDFSGARKFQYFSFLAFFLQFSQFHFSGQFFF